MLRNIRVVVCATSATLDRRRRRVSKGVFADVHCGTSGYAGGREHSMLPFQRKALDLPKFGSTTGNS